LNGNRNITILKPGQALTAGDAQHPTASVLEQTEFLDPVTIALSHARLQTLLPSGWRGTLPSEPAEGDPDRWRPDYSSFIERVLQLHAGCVNWLDAWIVDLNARGNFSDPGRVALLFETLEQLLHAGANPWAMRHLIELASWEARLAAEMAVFRQWRAVCDSPGRVLMTPLECAAWISRRRGVRLSVFADPSRLTRAKAGFAALNPRGVLGSLGYEVGLGARKAGVHPSHRRDMLRDALCIDLRDPGRPQTSAWWGPAGTEARANSIERCIEMFVRLARARTSGDWDKAIDDWESDLRWLQVELMQAASISSPERHP
jgi:hypothetical protein